MPPKKENDYVTKKFLKTSLDRAVEDITHVIRDGFSLAATKEDLKRVETRLESKMDKGFEDLGEKIEKLQFETSSHEERITKLERKSHVHA